MVSNVNSLSSGRVKFLGEVVFREFPQHRSSTNKATLMMCLEERICAVRSLWTGSSETYLEENEELLEVEEYEELIDEAGLYYRKFEEQDNFLRYFISWKKDYLDNLDTNPFGSRKDARRSGEVLGYPEESIDYFIESDTPKADSIEFARECYDISEMEAECLFSLITGFLGYITAPSEDSWDYALSRSKKALCLYSEFMKEYIIPSLESEEDVEKALDHIQSLDCSSV